MTHPVGWPTGWPTRRTIILPFWRAYYGLPPPTEEDIIILLINGQPVLLGGQYVVVG